jgi:hypothetical protein
VIAELRERRFDAAVIFTSFRQSPLPAAYLCYLAGIPLRLAASIDGPGSLALAGALPFEAFCALIESADLVVTNNTGPMRLAAALQTPVVALFALTNPPEQWGSWRVPHRLLFHEVPCRICYSRVCPVGHECLRLVSPQMVADAAAELLGHQGRGLRLGRQPLSSRSLLLGAEAERSNA